MKLYDSLSRSKKDLKPLQNNKMSMYVCGITPDNATHLGHAFTYTFFDVLVRYLTYQGFSVNYLQNATDINDSDDVIKQARVDGITWRKEAQFWINHFHKQMDALNILRPTRFVLATSVIPEIIKANSRLLEKGFAYESQGNLYFEVKKFKKYGVLSHLTRQQMLQVPEDRGTNILDKNKRDPLDFVLWFGDTNNPYWDSPWGKGRPGWHIECSTMIDSILGPQIDIHGGGEDLIYPHHESEIAQSESFTGKSPFVKHWMHTAYVLYKGEKMSKSLGNLVLVSDLLKKYSPNTIRWAILSHHYGASWEFKEEELGQIEKRINPITESLKNVKSKKSEVNSKFEKFMDDDLDTPPVLEFIEKLFEENKLSGVKKILEILGFTFY